MEESSLCIRRKGVLALRSALCTRGALCLWLRLFALPNHSGAVCSCFKQDQEGAIVWSIDSVGSNVAVIVSERMSLAPFKRPPSPSTLASLATRRPRYRRRKVKVMDEDDYVEEVSAIIERDFFPELEKLEAQHQYLDASERNDVATMNRLREQYSSTGPIKHQRPGQGSPDTFETPAEERRQDDVEGESKKPVKPEDDERRSESGEQDKDQTRNMSLDEFMAKHTSEDNESFNEIQEESRRKFVLTHSWMFKEDEQKSIEMKKERLQLPSIEVQNEKSEDSGVSKTPDGWTYRNQNEVFYPPEGAPLSAQEIVELAKKERGIVFENTRFKKNPWKSELQDSSLQESVYSKKEKEAGKVGVDGKTVARPETPSVNGFKFLRMTPSPMPGAVAGESPLMTWGEVESTPFRLEGCETPLPMHATGGPSFTIQDVPKRDRIAHALAEKNSKFYRDKKGKAIQNARSNIRTPAGKRNMNERVASMSPAAQRLATSKLGIRLGTDKALRASYTPSPASSRRSTTVTPGRTSVRKAMISSSIRCKGATTPKTPSTPSLTDNLLNLKQPSSLTDNLLSLPSSSSSPATKSASEALPSGGRQRAADFL